MLQFPWITQNKRVKLQKNPSLYLWSQFEIVTEKPTTDT